MGGTTCVAAKGIDKGNASSKLDGQKVAVPLGTMADYVFKETMRVVGADISKMKVVDMNPEDGSAAFVNGDVAMACLFGGKSIKAAKEKGASLLTVKEAQDAGIAGIDITSVTNKFLKENPGMVRTFVEVTHESNARYNDGKADMNIIAKDAAMDLAGTKKQMGGFEFPNAGKSDMNIIATDAAMDLAKTKGQIGGFEFPNAGTMKSKYMNNGGILMTYLELMGNMFATSENPALKDYSKVVDTSYLPN